MKSLNMKWSPSEYADASFLAREASTEMLSRLDLMTIAPRTVVDVGCGLGEDCQQLQVRYPQAQIFALDRDESMIQAANHSCASNIHCIQADLFCLPFTNASIDLIFINFVLPWQVDIQQCLQEIRRVLSPNGLIMLSTLGPDTLREWRDVMQNHHIPVLMDMHNFGDLILKVGLVDPVIDVNYYTVNYQDQQRFINEMMASGFWFPDEQTKLDMLAWMHENSRPLEMNCEMVFAHAFAPMQTDTVSAGADGNVRIPLQHLRASLRHAPPEGPSSPHTPSSRGLTAGSRPKNKD